MNQKRRGFRLPVPPSRGSRPLALTLLAFLSLMLGTVLVPGASTAQEKDTPAAQQEPEKWPEDYRVYLKKKYASTLISHVKVVDNRGWQGGPIRVAGKEYARGLGVHASSRIEFPLDGGFQMLHVTPGPDDAHTGVIRMIIKVDDKVRFDSGLISSQNPGPCERQHIFVGSASMLTLIVERAEGGRRGDHACWADACLTREKEKDPAATVSETTVQPVRIPKRKLQPFLDNYCTYCHGPDVQEAGVRFDRIDWEITNNDSAQRWQDVLDQLNGGDMPPEDEDQPSADELAAALDTLTGALVNARQRLTDHGGAIQLRRLNRREYSNTIEDLFGFMVPPDWIPEDGEFSSFDTVGAEQLFNSGHFDQYLELGMKLGFRALEFNNKPRRAAELTIYEPETKETPAHRENLADLDHKMEMKKAGATWQEMGFKDEGQMNVIFRQFDTRAGNSRKYLQLPHIQTGAWLSDAVRFIQTSRNIDVRGEYILRVRGGIVGDADPIRSIVRVSDSYGLKGTLQIAGTPGAPETVELRTRLPVGKTRIQFRIQENIPAFASVSPQSYLRRLQETENTDVWSTIWIDRLEIDGPYYPETRPWFEQVLYPDGPTGKSESPYLRKDARAKELIEKFATRAFRNRKPSKQFINALHQRFVDKRNSGEGFIASMSEVMGIVLASPGFLYLHEDSGEQNRQLDNRELAVRLSYFLWSGPPDEQLFAAELDQPEVLAAQVERMLDDPRSDSFLDGFVSQWAELDRFDAITVDEREYFRFNPGVRYDAAREVQEFFGTLVRENLPVSNLIDSDFVTINPTLAIHYGIENVHSTTNEFVKVPLPEDSPRGGLMTQAAFLITGSNGERSSPVIRGALVMEKLLHDKPAPPPPNVPELGTAGRKARSNRDLVQLHQEQAVCASCHRKMDAIGFGLENFDAIGMWREQEKVRKTIFPIDPSGALPDGREFETVHDLKRLLSESEEDLVRELTGSILGYALGRTIEFSDTDEVDRLVKIIRADGGRMRTVIREVVLSPLFGRK